MLFFKKQYLKAIFFIAFTGSFIWTDAQVPMAKIVAECAITYSVTITDGNKVDQSVKKLYIKGKKTRSEIKTETFEQATIYDNKTGDAVVLKEVSGDKFLSQFNAEQWKQKNERWLAATTKITGETKKILNYNCRKAIITTKDGDSFSVYYTTDMNASASENPYQFKNIPGLILEYNSKTSTGKGIEFKAIDVEFNPIPVAKFAIPTSGYRVI